MNSPLQRRLVAALIVAVNLAGCATKKALLGVSGEYTRLPTGAPEHVYGEVACPSAGPLKEDEPLLADRMYRLESGSLWSWMGGDSAYMSGHDFGRWVYTKDDPTVTQWLALVDREHTMGGSAIFYVEDLGGTLKLGNLVLMPEDGKAAYRLVYANKSSIKWKLDKIGESVRVKPMPSSVPISTECFGAVDEGWPVMEPAPSVFYYKAGLEVRALYRGGDYDGAKALLLDNDLLNKRRYADEELVQLLFFWTSMSDDMIPDYPLLVDYKLADRAALWELIESKYQALVDAGKAPARARSNPLPADPPAEAPADPSAEGPEP